MTRSFFFWCKFGFGKCFGASSWSKHCTGHRWLSYKIHFLLCITVWSRNGSWRGPAHESSTYWAFSPSNLLQVPNDHRMIDVEFFGNFCSWERISLDDGSQLFMSPSDGRPLCSSFSRLLSPLQNHCTERLLAVPGPNALLMLWVVFATIGPILNPNKIDRICFLSNIISLVYNKYCCYCLVAQLCLTLCDPMDCGMPGPPHHLPEFSQVHVHCISDAIQTSHHLIPSSSALKLSQHQDFPTFPRLCLLFQNKYK